MYLCMILRGDTVQWVITQFRFLEKEDSVGISAPPDFSLLATHVLFH